MIILSHHFNQFAADPSAFANEFLTGLDFDGEGGDKATQRFSLATNG